MTAAIYYHPEAYTTSGPKLMGRNAAGETFLRGFLLHSKTTEFWTQVQKLEHARLFAQTAQTIGRAEPVKAVDMNGLGALAQVGMVYYPGPGIGEHAYHRSAFGHGAWSLCGITHTTSSAGAMDALTDLITAPVQSWDALICTSAAVKDNVTRMLQAQVDYLHSRLGITRVVLPKLPVIPLGIHTVDFAYTVDQKAQARSVLGVDSSTVVVLFMGRLSFHAKAHPLAMYQALEIATKSSGKRVLLLECGWHANDYIERAYEEAARLACPSVHIRTLDGRKAEDRQIAWAGADVFCSLSDNIQETFGIAPIEAMAAGLPVVVSDWDGYKDTVREGVDGFRIPTLMPEAGFGGDLSTRHALDIDTYDMYCGHTCSLIAVDVVAASQAFLRLIQSSELRSTMGESGKKRAVEFFDWRQIIPRYEALWAELQEIRRSTASALTPLSHPWPARLDPFHGFAAYPTRTLNAGSLLALVDDNAQEALNRTLAYRQLAMIDFAKLILPSEAEIRTVLQVAAVGPKPAQDLVAQIDPGRRGLVLRSLAWLVKLGILKLC